MVDFQFTNLKLNLLRPIFWTRKSITRKVRSKMNTVLFLKNMVLISMNDMFGINDFAPLGLGGRNYNLPRALLGADDLRTFGASILPHQPKIFLNYLFGNCDSWIEKLEAKTSVPKVIVIRNSWLQRLIIWAPLVLASQQHLCIWSHL